jgi:(p)ppGpp synthase/HD superfamily hydrolase
MRAKNHILQSIIVCGKLELQNKTEDKKMAYSIDVAAARALATKAHEGQTDKAGLPYITHPERVALRMESPELQVIGWLHDTVEDTTLTVKDIAERFGPETAASVDAISRRDGEKWSGYLDRVAANPMARQVKISDLIDNSNLSRIPHVTLKDVERQKKYNKALKKLLEEE